MEEVASVYAQRPSCVLGGRNAVNMLDGLAALNERHFQRVGDPETAARINQYELAFKMQMEAPGILDISAEPETTFELYGQDAKEPGTFAANCLRARRMAESGEISLGGKGGDEYV